MTYRVVYNVLDDAALPGHSAELIFLAAAVFWTLGWFTLVRIIGDRLPNRRRMMRGGLIIGAFFVCIGIVSVATGTYPVFADQRDCKDRIRSGEFEVVEGPIARIEREGGRSPPTNLEVGAVRFTYRTLDPKTGGFHGTFTAPEAQDLKLQAGQAVRIAHWQGRILRLEIAK